jgi:hypothetical protein
VRERADTGDQQRREERSGNVSTGTIAVIAENVVLLAAIITGGHLFRQGGGWQLKTPPVPKAPAQGKGDAKAAAPPVPAADPATAPIPPLERVV